MKIVDQKYLSAFLTVLMGCILLTGCSGNKASVKPAIQMGDQMAITATVEAIDYNDREVTIKGLNGKSLTMVVGDDAYNFENIEVGDLVDITYRTSVAIRLQAATGEEPTGTTEKRLVRVPGGQKPEGVLTDTMNVRAIVNKIDYETRMVELRGPNGNIISVEIGEDVKNFNNIKQGDEVLATYTEAVAYTVRPAEK